MYDLKALFGVSSDQLALADRSDPQTPQHRTYATAQGSGIQPPPSAGQALLDPYGSAIFWVAAAAVLGLILVTGQLHVEAALGGRAGRK